jgi:hypothetical protein
MYLKIILYRYNIEMDEEKINEGKLIKAIINKITSLNTEKVYIGSTTQKLKDRMQVHVSKFKNRDKYKPCHSCEVIECGDATIEAIVEVEGTKYEVHKLERQYIELYKGKSVNKVIPTRTSKEYRDDHKEERKGYQKNYRNENKVESSMYSKKYYEINQNIIKENQAQIKTKGRNGI